MVMRTILVAVLIGLLPISVNLSFAFTPPAVSPVEEIPLPGSDRVIRVDLVREGDPRIDEFSARFGGSWSVDWNDVTGSPSMVLGSGTQFASSVASASDAEDQARRVIETASDLLGVHPSDLDVVHTASGMGKWSVIFQQTYQGIPVEGGRAHVVFTEGGRLMALGSDAYPVEGVVTQPVLTEADAVIRAGAQVGFEGTGNDEITEAGLVILPLQRETGVDYRLAYRLSLFVEDPLGHWLTYVDAVDGTILGRSDLIRMETIQGTSEADVQFTGYCDGVTPGLPMRNMHVTAVGQGSDVTGADGEWSIDVAGGGPFTVEAELRGLWVDVNVAGTPPDASFSGEAYPGTPLTITWDSARNDERDCYYNVNWVHDKIKEIDPTYTGVDYEMDCNVNRTDYYCPGNAWWDGSAVNFCEAGSGYANTGEIGNVVYHEYTHGITDFLYGGYDPPGDLHEGNSDVMACFLQDVSIVGLGFYQGNCTSGIRDLDNSLIYPDDLSGEGHHDGQIIGGFHWDARGYLEASLGVEEGREVAWNTWHYGRKLGLPQSQPQQVLWTFIADDDDGDLENGTPHHAELCQAAANHGFGCPEILTGVIISHLPLPTTTDPTRIHQTKSAIYSTEAALNPDSLFLYYRVNGGDFTRKRLMPNYFLDLYLATIPTQPMGTEVEYYLFAADAAGNSRTSPTLAPDVLHAFDIAYVFDPAEEDQGWTLGLPGDDATTGMWQRCDPEGTEAQPEDDHTPPPGVDAFITWCEAGSGLGSYDVDGGTTTLVSPVFNVAGMENVRVKYYRWYTNNTGSNPGEDYWVVDISNDGGDSWVNVENTNESDHSWRAVTASLADYFPSDPPGDVQVRFLASDLLNGSLVEGGVDDFEILADAGTGTDVEIAGTRTGQPSSYALHAACPNPFNPETVIAYDLPKESRVSLKIFNVAGREVRTLVSTTQPAGRYALVWDGRDANGQTVASGVYFYRLTAGQFGATDKMTLMK